ncbi:response regulator [Deinococcus aquatilis]|jgi:CheY-like chemotaxis protein|uniref:response regulator n=1 Tax=Deinococcus aquatilis TaxID=519440 RepID=UPI000373D273|nr:response regulator [Deinococcus aquatilis]
MSAPTPPPTILIVDDSSGVRLMLARLLAPHLSVRLADGVSSAMDALTPETALVLSDVRMPGESGLDLARTLREQRPNLPVVLMTGVVEDELRAQALELGVLDVLRKPITPGTLFPALRGWLGEGLEAVAPAIAAQKIGVQAANAPLAQAAQPSEVGLPTHLDPEANRALMAGVALLPGVAAVAHYDAQGGWQEGQGAALPSDLGQSVRVLVMAARISGPHLGTPHLPRSVQVEYQDRVLVALPLSDGFLAVLVRDTPGASTVKAWLRNHLSGMPGMIG